MNRLSLILCAAALAAASAVPALADGVVFNQPLDTNPDSVLAFLSESAPNGQYFASYDHFSFAQNITVSSIEWSGFQIDGKSVGNFDLTVYADNNGHPGDILYTQDDGTGNPFTLYVYPTLNVNQYSATTDLRLNANTKYWFSAVAVDPSPGAWYWADSQYGDYEAEHYHPTDPFEPAGEYPIDDNLAFTMYGSPTDAMPPSSPPPPPPSAVTPEPASLVLMGSGVLTMAGMVRRRWAQRQGIQQ
jgi:hypothetical protein